MVVLSVCVGRRRGGRGGGAQSPAPCAASNFTAANLPDHAAQKAGVRSLFVRGSTSAPTASSADTCGERRGSLAPRALSGNVGESQSVMLIVSLMSAGDPPPARAPPRPRSAAAPSPPGSSARCCVAAVRRSPAPGGAPPPPARCGAVCVAQRRASRRVHVPHTATPPRQPTTGSAQGWSSRLAHAGRARRVRVEIMGAPTCRNVGESQSALIMIDPMISTRTGASW
jgi:hypothetical protein